MQTPADAQSTARFTRWKISQEYMYIRNLIPQTGKFSVRYASIFSTTRLFAGRNIFSGEYFAGKIIAPGTKEENPLRYISFIGYTLFQFKYNSIESIIS